MYHVFCPSGGGNVFFAVVKFYRQEEEEEVSGLKKSQNEIIYFRLAYQNKGTGSKHRAQPATSAHRKSCVISCRAYVWQEKRIRHAKKLLPNKTTTKKVNLAILYHEIRLLTFVMRWVGPSLAFVCQISHYDGGQENYAAKLVTGR